MKKVILKEIKNKSSFLKHKDIPTYMHFLQL